MGRRLSPRRGRSGGSLFIDVLVALLISSAALLATLGGVLLAARVSQKLRGGARELVAVRNEQVRSQRHVFAASPAAR